MRRGEQEPFLACRVMVVCFEGKDMQFCSVADVGVARHTGEMVIGVDKVEYMSVGGEVGHIGLLGGGESFSHGSVEKCRIDCEEV